MLSRPAGNRRRFYTLKVRGMVGADLPSLASYDFLFPVPALRRASGRPV